MNIISYLKHLQSLGLKIQTVYDVGACKGAWSLLINREALPESSFYLFEANPAYISDLQMTGFPYLQTVLSNPGREFVDFYNGCNTGDSYYKELSKHYENQGSIRLPCTTLDAIVNQFNLPIPNLLKIDTQGSELDILEGSKTFLKNVDLIFTECPIVPYNKDAPNIHQYIEYIRDNDFIPVNLLECHVFENTLLQIDIMFMRRDIKYEFLGRNEFFKV